MSVPSLVGSVLAGRFRIVEYLGEGAVGDVYLAEHEVLRRRYAIKLLKQQFRSHPTIMERFRREAQVASRLEHPNIVYISDFGRSDDGRLYIAMEYIPGATLGAAVSAARPGVFPLRRALRIFKQMASALTAAHAAGVLHRDLKPDNVMLSVGPSGKDVVKVFDFGLAKIMGLQEGMAITQRGAMFGTPSYMAPEQARGEDLDERADIYSLGACLFEVLTTRPPLVFASLHEIIVAIQRSIPPSCAQVRPRGAEPLPAELTDLVQRCLEKDPALRPQRMSQVTAVIDACLTRVAPVTRVDATTLDFPRVDLADLLARAPTNPPVEPAPSTAGGSEAVSITSVTEISPTAWREVCRRMKEVAALLSQLSLASPGLAGTLDALATAEAATREAEVRAEEPDSAAHQRDRELRELCAQLRHGVIDLSLARGRLLEQPEPAPEALSDLDQQIRNLELSLGEHFVEARALQGEIGRADAALDGHLEQVRQAQVELELALLDALRGARPPYPPPGLAEAYAGLEQALQGNA